MSLEGPKGADKHRRLGAKESVFFATSLLGAIDHGPVQALEIPEATPWAIAIQQNVHAAVLHEKNETAISYVQFSDGRAAWIKLAEGNATSVGYTNQREIEYLGRNINGRSIEVRCDMHTHPEQSLSVGGKTIVFRYSPPSPQDVSADTTKADKSILDSYNKKGFPLKRSISALADASGVWYFDPSSVQVITTDALKRWEVAYNAFGFKSLQEELFDFSKELALLRDAYRVHLGANVRFVSYKDLSKEAPCAGVDYRPNYEVKVNQPKSGQGPVEAQKKVPDIRQRPKDVPKKGPEMKPETPLPSRGDTQRPSLGELVRELDREPKTRPHIPMEEPRTRPNISLDGPPQINVGRPQQ